MLIHISGLAGSGKSTLGKKLRARSRRFKIIETDSFVTSADRKKRDKIRGETAQIKFIYGIYRSKFDFYNKKYKNIIYVGLLNSSVPGGALYSRTEFDHKLFLEVPVETYIRRYFSREVKNGVLKERDLCDVVSGEWVVLGTLDLLHNYEHRKEGHKGYKFMSGDEIGSFIRSLEAKPRT